GGGGGSGARSRAGGGGGGGGGVGGGGGGGGQTGAAVKRGLRRARPLTRPSLRSGHPLPAGAGRGSTPSAWPHFASSTNKDALARARHLRHQRGDTFAERLLHQRPAEDARTHLPTRYPAMQPGTPVSLH